jgi:outer membrane protein OmpA-like peptidoglycan-associated protein
MSLNKNLIEEINRFRMMSSYKPGKLLNEQDINEAPKFPEPTPTPKKYSVAEKELVQIDMVRVLTDIIEKDQNAALSQIPVKLTSKFELIIEDNTTLKFVGGAVKNINLGNQRWTEKVRDMRSVEDRFIDMDRPGIALNGGKTINIGNYYQKLLDADDTEGKQFTSFFEKYKDKYLESGVSISDYVKQQLENVQAKVYLVPVGFKERFVDESYKIYEKDFGFVLAYGKISKREFNDYGHQIGEELTLKEIAFPDKPVYVGPNHKDAWKLESKFLELSFADLALSIPPELQGDGDVPPTPTPTPTPTPEVIAFDFVVETTKNYEFDKADLTQEAKDEIDKNVTAKFLNILPKYQEGYLNFIKDKEITVYAYASIDADPDYNDGGYYEGCSQYGVGKGPRKLYNKCLSQARAQKVVDYLKTTQGGIFKDINFKPVGMGETCKFSNLCWTVKNPGSNEKSPYSTSKTYPDRRFSVNFPNYHADF